MRASWAHRHTLVHNIQQQSASNGQRWDLNRFSCYFYLIFRKRWNETDEADFRHLSIKSSEPFWHSQHTTFSFHFIFIRFCVLPLPLLLLLVFKFSLWLFSRSFRAACVAHFLAELLLSDELNRFVVFTTSYSWKLFHAFTFCTDHIFVCRFAISAPAAMHTQRNHSAVSNRLRKILCVLKCFTLCN